MVIYIQLIQKNKSIHSFIFRKILLTYFTKNLIYRLEMNLKVSQQHQNKESQRQKKYLQNIFLFSFLFFYLYTFCDVSPVHMVSYVLYRIPTLLYSASVHNSVIEKMPEN